MTKFCKDCQHYEPANFKQFNCARRVEERKSPITGESCGPHVPADDEREAGYIISRLFGHCGKEGRFWLGRATVTTISNGGGNE
jgi:hypothetical protein